MKLREQCKVKQNIQRIGYYITSVLKIESGTNSNLVLGRFYSIEVLKQILKYHICVAKD